MQNITSDKLIGRDTAGSGDPEEISVGGGIKFTGTGRHSTFRADRRGNGVGCFKQHSIANNAVAYAKMQDVSAASKLLGRGDSGSGDPQEITLGAGLAMSGTTLLATAKSPLTASCQTWSSATALAARSAGGTRISNGFTLDIPQSGQIRVTLLQCRISETSGTDTGSFAFGIEINGSTKWMEFENVGASTFNYAPAILLAPNYTWKFFGAGNTSPDGYRPYPAIAFDIEAMNISTGIQTACYIRGADNAEAGFAGELTLQGTGTTAVYLIEVIDCG